MCSNLSEVITACLLYFTRPGVRVSGVLLLTGVRVSGVPGISILEGINLTQIIHLPHRKLVALLSCPFELQCMAILGV